MAQLRGQAAGVMNMPGTRVIGRKRKPEAFRQRQVRAETITQPVKVLDATADTVIGVGYLAHAHGFGGTRH